MYDKIEAYNQALAAYRGYNEYDDAFESVMDDIDDMLYDAGGYDYDDYSIEGAVSSADFAYQSAMLALEGSSTVSAGGGGIFGKIWGAIKKAWNFIKEKVTNGWNKIKEKFSGWADKARGKRKEKYDNQYDKLNKKLGDVDGYASDDAKKREKALRDYVAIADSTADKIVSTSNKVVSNSASIINNFGKILTKVYSNHTVEDKSKAYAKTASGLAEKLGNVVDEFSGAAKNWETMSDSLQAKYKAITTAASLQGQPDFLIKASTRRLQQAGASINIVQDTCTNNMRLVDSIENAAYKNDATGSDAMAVAQSYKNAVGGFNSLTATLLSAINNMITLFTNFGTNAAAGW